MGYVSKVIICKRGNSQSHEWVGERNLMVYDRDFEKQLKEATTEFYR